MVHFPAVVETPMKVEILELAERLEMIEMLAKAERIEMAELPKMEGTPLEAGILGRAGNPVEQCRQDVGAAAAAAADDDRLDRDPCFLLRHLLDVDLDKTANSPTQF